MKTVSLALRNLLRNRRRSFTTLLALVIGICSILLFGGFSRYITYGLQTGFVRQSGHLQIQRENYFLYGNGNPAAYGISGYRQLIATIKQDPVLKPLVRVVTPTLQVSGIAGNFSAGASRTVAGRGVVVDEQNSMRLWNDYDMPAKAPQLALTHTGEDAAVIGTGVARVLQLCGPLKVDNCPQFTVETVSGASAPDDVLALSALEKADAPRPGDTHIELLTASLGGAPNVARLAVVKTEVQGVKEVDDTYVALHLTQAQRLVYGNGEPQVTAVLVQLHHGRDMNAARARLEQLIAAGPGKQRFEIHDYATLNPFYGQSIAMFDAILGFISLLIGAIVLFTIGNTMSMAVAERTVEIGTLRAMGLRRSGIRRLFITEGLLLGGVGAVLGVLIALVLAYAVNQSGITWNAPGRVEPILLLVRVWDDKRLIAVAGLGLMLVASLSAFWPAHRASGMNIVDALRHV
ncbi:ABC transporter permease [Piscinibacter sp.]|uniref:ABC transporter permease n=1 Tax=Piscinibacter sp. TaxID=1903157 RepID=UPI002B6BD21E|nr:FtsX-like permease family protein [Albitalea sp.]HUG26210.1 FtsX-like permease family protein [Albitalea sp.]